MPLTSLQVYIVVAVDWHVCIFAYGKTCSFFIVFWRSTKMTEHSLIAKICSFPTLYYGIPVQFVPIMPWYAINDLSKPKWHFGNAKAARIVHHPTMWLIWLLNRHPKLSRKLSEILEPHTKKTVIAPSLQEIPQTGKNTQHKNARCAIKYKTIWILNGAT